MTRLAGITAAYALIAALVLVAPLSASEDPMPEPAAPEATEQPQDALLQPAEPAAAAPEAAPPKPPSAETTPPPDPTAPAEQTPLPQPSPAPAEPAVEELEEAAPSKPRSRRTANAPRATAAADTGVTISDFQFAPSSVTVDAGDTVTWTNDDTVDHDVTGDGFKSGDAGGLASGDTYKHKFDKAGTFKYSCTVHPGMTGEVDVK